MYSYIKKHPEYYLQVPFYLLSSDLSKNEILILSLLLAMRNNPNCQNTVKISDEEMANILNMTRQNYSKIKRGLEKKGFFKSESGLYTRTEYTIDKENVKKICMVQSSNEKTENKYSFDTEKNIIQCDNVINNNQLNTEEMGTCLGTIEEIKKEKQQNKIQLEDSKCDINEETRKKILEYLSQRTLDQTSFRGFCYSNPSVYKLDAPIETIESVYKELSKEAF